MFQRALSIRYRGRNLGHGTHKLRKRWTASGRLWDG